MDYALFTVWFFKGGPTTHHAVFDTDIFVQTVCCSILINAPLLPMWTFVMGRFTYAWMQAFVDVNELFIVWYCGVQYGFEVHNPWLAALNAAASGIDLIIFKGPELTKSMWQVPPVQWLLRLCVDGEALDESRELNDIELMSPD